MPEDSGYSQEHFEAAASSLISHYVGQARVMLRTFLNHACESPVERRFLLALAVVDPECVFAATTGVPLGSTVRIQAPIGPYRADFVIEERGWSEGIIPGKVVVEIDGHDFHERTKAQAEKDRKRDRQMQAHGYKVFRFTGSEIHRDAFRCAGEVWNELLRASVK